MEAMPANPSENWLIGFALVSALALLGFLVKWMTKDVAPAINENTKALAALPGAIREAVHDGFRSVVEKDRV